MIPAQKDENILLSRRNVIMTALISPFLLNTLLNAQESNEKGSLSTNTETDFVILGGWVFLKNDLFGNLG